MRECEADELSLAAGVKHLREGAVRQHDATVGRERDDSGGYGLNDRFELGPSRLQRQVQLGELCGGASSRGVSTLQVSSHGIETLNQLSKLFRGGLADTMRIVTIRDSLHRIGQGLDRSRDLFAQIER